jgi:hypothetical protein
MTPGRTTACRWRKAYRSQNEGACVELSHTLDAVRDAKNGAILAVPLPAFITAMRSGSIGRVRCCSARDRP